jgi:HlyD family secretion protein
MSRKKKKIIIAIVVSVILLVVVGFSINARRKEQVPVQSGKVEDKDLLIAKVQATGEIKPRNYVALQAEIAGVITELKVKEGDRVQRGDLLLKIDPTQTETELRAQQAMLEVAMGDASNQNAQIRLQETSMERDRANIRVVEAELTRSRQAVEIARNNFNRRQQLHEENLISRELYDSARNELLTAETQVLTAEARVMQAIAELAVAEMVLQQQKTAYQNALSRVNQQQALVARNTDLFSKTVIRSPLSGVITKLNVEAGERAVPGNLNNPLATLMEIADLSIIEAEVQVDETDIVNVALGQIAEVKVDALPDKPLKGIVTEIGNSAIQKTGQTQEAKDFKVVIQLEDPVDALRPGLSCTAEITTASREDVLVIPIQALTIREFEVDDDGNMIKPEKATPKKSETVQAATKAERKKRKEFQGVFLLTGGKAEFVQVETGITGDTDIEVKSGLKEGDEIVIGSYKALRTLKDGDLVKIENQGKS